jgi:hypothetical protein
MGMHIFLESDGFHNAAAHARSQGMGLGGQSTGERDLDVQSTVRRPYRGVQIKDDVYAVLSVRKPDGSAIPLTSSSAYNTSGSQGDRGEWTGQVKDFSDFILQRVEDQRMEKQQIIETFGDTFVYFFGERPRMLTFSGVLMNTEDFNWRAQFWQNYDLYLRGTKLVQMNARCYLSYDTCVIEGYPLSCTAVDDADAPYTVQFQMQMLVTNYYEYSAVGTIQFPGVEAQTTDILNLELEAQRKKFVSITSQVRFKNATATGPTGFLAKMRSVIREARGLETMAYNYLDVFRNFTSGRLVRLPVGIAAFVSGTDVAEVAGNSISAAGSAFINLKTGAPSTVAGVPVNHKLRMLGPSKFGPTWLSAVTGKAHGAIYENYDEYPIRQQPSATADLLTPAQQMEMVNRDLLRIAVAEERQATLAAITMAQQAEGLYGDAADVIGFLRSSFSLVTTVAGFISDPLGTVSNTLLGVAPNQLELVALGVVNGLNPIGKFIGTAGGRTLDAMFSEVKDNFTEESKIGDVYLSTDYLSYNKLASDRSGISQTGRAFNTGPAGSDVVYSEAALAPEDQPVLETGSAARSAAVAEVYTESSYRSPTDSYRDRNYEAAYQDADYAALMEQQRAKDAAAAEEAATLVQGLASGNEDAVKSALDDAYGERDTASEEVIETKPVTVSTPVGRTTPEYTTQQTYYERETMAPDEAIIVTREIVESAPVGRIIPEAEPEQVYGPSATSLLTSSDVKSIFTGTKTRPMTEPEYFAQVGAQVSPKSIEDVYGGEGIIQRKTLTAEERAALLALVYGSPQKAPKSPQDTSGIMPAGDVDAEIKPVV